MVSEVFVVFLRLCYVFLFERWSLLGGPPGQRPASGMCVAARRYTAFSSSTPSTSIRRRTEGPGRSVPKKGYIGTTTRTHSGGGLNPEWLTPEWVLVLVLVVLVVCLVALAVVSY